MVDAATLTSANLTSLNNAESNVAKSQKDRQTLTGNFNDFLTLFITQLKYQDPLEPMDNSQFTQSLASLSAVEQSINTNTHLEELISLQSSGQVNNTVQYIDKSVDYQSNQLQLKNSNAVFNYDVAESPDDVLIAVADASGKVVFTADGKTGVGNHEFIWNGQDFNGNQLSDGTYKVSVSEVNGEDVDTLPVTSQGIVTSVTIDGAEITLNIGDIGVSLEDITTIRSTIN